MNFKQPKKADWLRYLRDEYWTFTKNTIINDISTFFIETLCAMNCMIVYARNNCLTSLYLIILFHMFKLIILFHFCFTCLIRLFCVVLCRLTNEEARKNWEEYGNPDGPGGQYNISICVFVCVKLWKCIYHLHVVLMTEYTASVLSERSFLFWIMWDWNVVNCCDKFIVRASHSDW